MVNSSLPARQIKFYSFKTMLDIAPDTSVLPTAEVKCQSIVVVRDNVFKNGM